MPSSFSGKDVIFNQNARLFLQAGGAGALNPMLYSGRQTHWLTLDGLDVPVSGGSSRTLMHSPEIIGGYENVGTVTEPTTDLITTTLHMWRKVGALVSLLQNTRQTYNLYVTVGACQDLTDPNGWTEFVRVHSGCQTTSISTGALVTDGETNETVADDYDIELDQFYDVGSLAAGAWGAGLVTRAIVDVTFAGNLVVGDCASNTDGSQWQYALQAGAEAAAPNVVYRTSPTSAAVAIALTGAANDEAAVGIKVFRNYLLVATEAALYVSTLSGIGVPSAFTKVTTGFTLPANAPADMTVSSSGVVIVGAGGYIYFTSDPLAGVSVVNAGAATTANLTRVRALSSRVIAGGVGGVLLSSADGGLTWGLILSAGADDVTAIELLSNRSFMVAADGDLFVTENDARSWTTKLTLGGTISDIVAPTRDAVFLSHISATPSGTIYHSYNGGQDWGSTANFNHVRLVNLPITNGISRMAYPRIGEPGIAANNLLLAGIADDGTDGALYSARANVI